MSQYETFSKRQKQREQAGQPDIYQYDDLPGSFRNQVIHIWQQINAQLDKGLEAFGIDTPSQPVWTFIASTVACELGSLRLASTRGGPFEQVIAFMQKTETSGALDLIDFAFHVINGPEFRQQSLSLGVDYDPEQATDDLNRRFREHRIGYQFTGGELIRVDSQFIHTEVVTSAISLLHDNNFTGAEDEFLRAHEHYRHGNNKEAVAAALMAFESTIKTICELRGWDYDKNAAVSKLIATIFEHELIPHDMMSYFRGFRSALESGLPTLRNKTSGHGQGPALVAIPSYFAAFALHLAASNIVFLVQAHKEKLVGS